MLLLDDFYHYMCSLKGKLWIIYNYKEEEYDFSYLLDKDLLEKYLDDDKYKIITKDHAFLRINKDLSMTDIETQELLLACDCLITDYSSVLFDAFPIDKKVFVIAKDYDKYDESRGLYEDMWEDLRPFVVNDEKSLANLIKNYSFDENYVKIKKKYCYDSLGNIVDFILEKLD